MLNNIYENVLVTILPADYSSHAVLVRVYMNASVVAVAEMNKEVASSLQRLAVWRTHSQGIRRFQLGSSTMPQNGAKVEMVKSLAGR